MIEPLLYMAQRPVHFKIGAEVLGEFRNVVLEDSECYMEKIKWCKKVTNKQVLARIGKKRTRLSNMLRRKANWIGRILRRNCLLHDATEGQMTEVKGVGRRRTQLLDDLRNRRRYWEISK